MPETIKRVQLEIKNVKIFLEGGDVKNVYVGGRTDILGHKIVKYFLDEWDGRILLIQGQMKYNKIWFDFEVGYQITPKIGKLTVVKKGAAVGELNIIQDAYTLLFDLYKQYFIT